MSRTPRIPRMYEPVWTALKADHDHEVELSVLPMHVSRVKKAISKEKLIDSTTAFLNREEGDNLKLVFKYDEAARILKVKVKQTLGISEMVV